MHKHIRTTGATWWWALLWFASWPLAASAQGTTAEQRQTEMRAASDAARAVQVVGPAEVKLRDQAQLKLPQGYVWIPEPAATQLMRAMGNHPDARQLGLVFPADDAEWMVVARYEAAGYIKDDDAREWNVDDMFTSLKEGTEAANKERSQRGFPELEIIGWVQKPTYDAQAHQLVWSMSAKRKGVPAGEGASINYNTYALGRHGYISLNLITDLTRIEADKVHAGTLLAGLGFVDGKRYADFDSKTDHVAEYGLAALVGGVAAKKLGLFAVIAAFLAKFAKVILIGGIALLGGLAKLLGRKKAE